MSKNILPHPNKHLLCLEIKLPYHEACFGSGGEDSLAKIVETMCNKNLGLIYSMYINFAKNVHII